MPMNAIVLQVRQLEGQLAEASQVQSAAALEARNSLQAAASDLQNARQEAQVLRASAGSQKDQALADLKVELFKTFSKNPLTGLVAARGGIADLLVCRR